jgi:hypothetical protein
MSEEEIIRMAREAGASTEIKHVTVGNGDGIVFTPDELARFADLVAAVEREACRKAAAAVDDEGSHNQRTMKRRIRAAIRARGQK